MDDATTADTREGLIWLLAKSIARAEGKNSSADYRELGGDRDYQIALIREAGRAVADALRPAQR